MTRCDLRPSLGIDTIIHSDAQQRVISMPRLAVAILACGIAGLVSSPVVAEEGCAGDQYWNGFRCAPIEQDGNYYGPPGRVVPGDRRGYEHYGQRRKKECYTIHGLQICCSTDLTPQEGRRGRLLCCPHGWTVQNGVCKPYRGY